MRPLRSLLLGVAVAAVGGCQETPRASSAPPSPAAEPSSPVSGVRLSSDESGDPIRVAIFWDARSSKAQLKFGQRLVKSDAEFQELLKFARADWLAVRKSEPALVIDAAREVPWGEIVRVISLCGAAQVRNVTLAIPAGE